MGLEMITKRLKILNDLQDELDKIKVVMVDSLENDPAYQALQAEAQKFKDEVKEKKAKVSSNETMQAMEKQMKELREDIKENKEVLAQELADYYKDSGSLQIIDDEGNQKRIIFSANL